MSPLIRKTLIILSAFLALFILIGVMLPTTVSINKSIKIDRPEAALRPLIEDMRNWQQWTPWLANAYRLESRADSIQWESGGSQSSIERLNSAGPLAFRFRLDEGIEALANFSFTSTAQSSVLLWEMDATISTPIVGGYLALLNEIMLEAFIDDALVRIKRAAETAPKEQ